MPYLTPKPKKAMAWLPTQVAYGMDVSDPDPANWYAFGELHEQKQAAAAKSASKPEKPPG